MKTPVAAPLLVALTCSVLLLAQACERSSGDDPSARRTADDPSRPATGPGSADSQVGLPDTGFYRAVDPSGPLTELQREEIEALNALGYVQGVQPAAARVGLLAHDPERAEQGLNLYVSAHAPEAVLMDMEGRTLHRWAVDFEEVWKAPAAPQNRLKQYWRRVHLLPDGDLLAIHEGLGIIRVDRDSRLRWAVRNGAHHDIFVGDDGNIYTLTRHAHVVPRMHPEKPILEDFIAVLGPDGQLKRTTSVLEALERSEFAHHLERRRPSGDIFHTNTLEILSGEHADRSPVFARGNALISIRELSLLAIVDPAAETVVWARTGEWREQHQPELLASGTMLLFDNKGRDGESQVLEFDPLDGEIAWSYDGTGGADGQPLFSAQSGSSQRLGNGNTLITESERGRAIEVTPEGEIVWEFASPHRAGEQRQWVAVLFEVVRLPEAPHRAWLDADG